MSVVIGGWLAVGAGAILPDPPYLIVPLCGALGGLMFAVRAWLTHVDPDWSDAWSKGSIVGTGVGALGALIAAATGVASCA